MTQIAPDKCPDCGQQELRPTMIGNNKDGWEMTGDFECDGCGEEFHPLEHSAYKDYMTEEVANLNAKQALRGLFWLSNARKYKKGIKYHKHK